MSRPLEDLRAALCETPDSAETLSALGQAHLSSRGYDHALSSLMRAGHVEPRHAGLAFRIGTALAALGRLPEAARHLCAAIAADPGHLDPYSNLAIVLLNGNFPDTGPILALLRRAVTLDPDIAAVQSNIGLILAERGDPDLAIPFDLRAAELDPAPTAWSRILFNLNYCESLSAEVCAREHRRIGALFEAAIMLEAPKPRAALGGRHRIGFVSPDFRTHSISYFLLPLLSALDRRDFEIFCYSDVAQPDAVTDRIRGLADHWRDLHGLSDRDAAMRIREDGIDSLIDLAGHTPRNRLGVFALRPAPIQMTWLGYANTTGLGSIDYRLVDAVTDPPDALAPQASETLLRLEGGFLCYEPPAHAPAVAARRAADRVTFGTFNNPSKIGESSIALWAQLLHRLSQADLLIKSYKLRDRALRERIAARFADHGIAADRLTLLEGTTDPAAHLAAYEKIDIALDPLIYNGTTTTCEALWMGVPVIALRGDRHAGRVGASLLTQLGLHDLIAETPTDYVEIACRLASDPASLAGLRGTFRGRMKMSSLCDAQGFARRFAKTVLDATRSASC